MSYTGFVYRGPFGFGQNRRLWFGRAPVQVVRFCQRLEPAGFVCYQHTDIDLTQQVADKVSAEPVNLTSDLFGRVLYSVPASLSGLSRRLASGEEFLVIVTCHGHDAVHEVACRGHWWEGERRVHETTEAPIGSLAKS